ncbi:MAG TPA: hypothetical protein PLE19_16095 [Planctomycetota bacterium]|nr:hypothetical protein [Planctomycetota bacterium]HRR80013.1 hypothetical protein [Planctomycetota bacterium]HRT97097.1 hypothetical protein [Planctomycetota bacterium]
MGDGTPSRRAIVAGDFLMVCGGVGLVTGLVPFAVSLLRLAGCDLGLGPRDWAAHGVEAMGLDVPWAALSSACGAFLGGLLVAAGLGWRRGRPWAPLVTLTYALLGITVTGVDLAIFLLAARPGVMRTSMLIADSLAFVLACGVLVVLAFWWRRRPP